MSEPQKNESEELRNAVSKITEEIARLQQSFEQLREAPPRVTYRTVLDSQQVSIRTSNCGRGWVLTTRGRNPHVPNFRKIVVNRPSFEMKQGVVYLLDEEEKNIISEAPPMLTVPKLSKMQSEKPQDNSRRAEIEAEEVLKSLGF